MMAAYLYAMGVTVAYCLWFREMPSSRWEKVMRGAMVILWPISVPLSFIYLVLRQESEG